MASVEKELEKESEENHILKQMINLGKEEAKKK
jgi:hypothetical protein